MERQKDLSPLISETPYKPFPFNSYHVIQIDDRPVVEYFSPEELERIVDRISNNIVLNSFQNIIINEKGGYVIYEMLRERQEFHGKVYSVSYHRPPDGLGVDIVVPIPGHICRDRNLIAEDIWDRGDTLEKMLIDGGEQTEVAVLYKKRGVEKQRLLAESKVVVGEEIDNVWVGGSGMNLDKGTGDIYPKDFLRMGRGLWVRPDSLPDYKPNA